MPLGVDVCQQGTSKTQLCNFALILTLPQHVRDGAVAMGDISPLLLHLRETWSEGYDESAAIIGVCKAVEMAASGILVSLREAGAIAEGLDIRARARTPMIRGTFESSRQKEDELDYERFKAAAEMVAEREQMESTDLSRDHQSPKSPQLPNALVGSKPVGIVRR